MSSLENVEVFVWASVLNGSERRVAQKLWLHVRHLFHLLSLNNAENRKWNYALSAMAAFTLLATSIPEFTNTPR